MRKLAEITVLRYNLILFIKPSNQYPSMKAPQTLHNGVLGTQKL